MLGDTLQPLQDLHFSVALVLVYFTFLWGHVAFVQLVVQRLPSFQKYRIQHAIQPDAPHQVQLTYRAYLHVLPGHVLSVLATLFYFRASEWGIQTDSESAPSLLSALTTLVVWHMLFDTWFYWCHRALHCRYLYKWIHKQHHEFKAPTAVAALYAHPLEDIFVNMGSTVIGPILYPAHGWILLVYMALRYYETTDAHCGYDFPWSLWRLCNSLHGGARRHDWHHSHIQGNYGGLCYGWS